MNVIGDANITGGLYVHGQNMTTPDYVLTFFKKEIEGKETNKDTQGYRLLTLPQLKDYILEHEQLPLILFKCAWFDENNYFEFFPLHVVKNY